MKWKIMLGNYIKKIFISNLDKIFIYLVMIYLFLNPFPYITAAKEITFYICLLIFVLLIMSRKMPFPKTPLNLPFLIFFCWSAVTLPLAINLANSFHDLFFHLLKYIIIFFFIFVSVQNKKQFNILAWTLIASNSLFSLLLIIYFYIMKGQSWSVQLGLGMDQISINIISVLIISPIIFSLLIYSEEKILNRKIILIVCGIIMTAAVFLTQTRSAILAIVFSFILIFPKYKKPVSVFLGLVLISMLFFPISERFNKDAIFLKLQSDERINIAYNFIEVSKEFLLTGVGFGMQTYADQKFLSKYNERVPPTYRQSDIVIAPHNMLIDVAVRTGIPGLILFIYTFFVFLRMGYKLYVKGNNSFYKSWSLYILAAFTAVFIQGLFENTLSGPPAIVLYTIFAMMAVLWKMDKNEIELNANETARP